MNGSNVWGSVAHYGDVLSLFQWNIYLQDKEYFPFKTVINDDSLQITLVEKNKCKVSFGICLITCTPIVQNFMKLLIFLIIIAFEQGENITKRCQ